MRSRTTKAFWKLHDALPPPVRLQAKIVYLRWKADPFHASLDFKRISRRLPVYSVRIGRSWRALGRRDGDTVTWFWIGSHEAYNTLLSECDAAPRDGCPSRQEDRHPRTAQRQLGHRNTRREPVRKRRPYARSKKPP